MILLFIIISNILSLLICSVIINMSGNLIGVNSILLFLSNLSPILSWFVLYNMYISHSIHYISKHWINISNILLSNSLLFITILDEWVVSGL